MSGIEYTAKEPREKVKRKLSKDATTAASRNFINDNPLEAGEFYVKIIDAKNHKRRFVTNELQVSIDGANWFEVSDVIKMIEAQKGGER